MTVAKDGGAAKRYRSPLREEQARRTRAAVLDAAAACFVETGYAATTMKDIAARAGVSAETVYAQGSKASLLLAAVDRVLVGDDEPVPVRERPGTQAVLDAPDARAAVHRLRDLAMAGLPRALPVLYAFQRAEGGDAEIAAAHATYEERRLADMRQFAEALAPALRPGVTVAEAADVLWALLDPTAVHRLVEGRGWTVRRWGDWFADAAERLLLR
jgi:AcrR family transcriptional regulator